MICKASYIRTSRSTNEIPLPRKRLSSIFNEFSIIFIPFSFQHGYDRCHAFTCRLSSHLDFVVCRQVRLRESRTIYKNLEPFCSKLVPLAGGHHIHSCLTDTIWDNFHSSGWLGTIQACTNGTSTAGNVDDTRRAGGLFQERREVLPH